MPKVGTKFFQINEEQLNLILWYTQAKGFTYKGVPSEMYRLTKFGNRAYWSENEINAHLRECIEEYHEKIKVTRKVISYTMKATASLIRNKSDNDSSYQDIKSDVREKFETEYGYDDNFAFGFSYRVMIEVSGTDRKRYYIVKEDDSISGYECKDVGLCIDWTPAREQFFKDMSNNLQKLVDDMSSFSDQPDLLLLMETVGIKAISDGK